MKNTIEMLYKFYSVLTLQIILNRKNSLEYTCS